MKTMKFQDDFSSNLFDNFENHENHVLVFNLTSIHDANENCHQEKHFGKPLKFELNFTFLHVFERIILGERFSSVAVGHLALFERRSKIANFAFRQIFVRSNLLRFRALNHSTRLRLNS